LIRGIFYNTIRSHATRQSLYAWLQKVDAYKQRKEVACFMIKGVLEEHKWHTLAMLKQSCFYNFRKACVQSKHAVRSKSRGKFGNKARDTAKSAAEKQVELLKTYARDGEDSSESPGRDAVSPSLGPKSLRPPSNIYESKVPLPTDSLTQMPPPRDSD